MLRLPGVQGRPPPEHQERLEEGRRREHHLPRIPHHRILGRLLRVPEQQAGLLVWLWRGLEVDY